MKIFSQKKTNNISLALQVAESLGFHSCIKSCLEYLEAAPWVGEEEERVLSSIRGLHQNDNFGISPILKRVSSEILNPPKEETLAQIIEICGSYCQTS